MKSLLLIFVLIISQAVYSQDTKLSKAEKKALIKEAKMYKSNPAKLKSLKQEMADLKSKTNSQEDELNQLAQEVEKQNEQIASLQTQLLTTKSEASKSQSSKTAPTKTPLIDQGITFRVQIGGYTKRDLSEYADIEKKYIKVEKNSMGIQEITLGYFTNYHRANDFKKHLRAMGLKDSWIVPYRDGKRVLLKDVLDEIDLDDDKISKN